MQLFHQKTNKSTMFFTILGFHLSRNTQKKTSFFLFFELKSNKTNGFSIFWVFGGWGRSKQVTLCFAMFWLCFAMFCYVLLRFVMFCYAVLYFAMFCYVFVMFCYVFHSFLCFHPGTVYPLGAGKLQAAKPST